MASPTPIEKLPSTMPITAPTPNTNSLMERIQSLYNSFAIRRESLGLSNPGNVDAIAREVQRDVLLTNLMFSGLRAELNKSLSIAPLFQISHAFSAGSQVLSPYTFLALYGTSNYMTQAQLDSDATFSARFNARLTQSLVFKSSVQIQPSQMGSPGASQLSLEQDYTGSDFMAQLKSINPSILEGGLTGMFIGSYMQSITPRLSLGLEGVWQRPGVEELPNAALSYAGRYKGDEWIGSLQVLAQGGLQGSYWRRLTDKVETGVDINLQFAGLNGGGAMLGAMQKEGTAVLGAKYEFSRSIFRAQVDSKGKVGCLLEKMVAPLVRVTFAGEMDHAKNAAKIGLAISLENSSEELMEQQDTVTPAMPPF